MKSTIINVSGKNARVEFNAWSDDLLREKLGEVQRSLSGNRWREAVFLHCLREVAHRADGALLESLSDSVRALLTALRDDGMTNGIDAFVNTRGGE